MPSTAPQAVLTHLDVLESESIHIFREVAAEFERPVLMFSGGEDSIVMLRLAEVLAARDRWVERLGVDLHIASVEQAIADGVVVDDGRTPRNRLQIGILLHAIESGATPRPSVAAGAMRRRPAPRSGSTPRAVVPLQQPRPPRRAHADLPAEQLDELDI